MAVETSIMFSKFWRGSKVACMLWNLAWNSYIRKQKGAILNDHLPGLRICCSPYLFLYLFLQAEGFDGSSSFGSLRFAAQNVSLNICESRDSQTNIWIIFLSGYHENVVTYYCSWFENEHLYIQLELCDHSLSVNTLSRSLTEVEALDVMYQVNNFILLGISKASSFASFVRWRSDLKVLMNVCHGYSWTTVLSYEFICGDLWS